MAKKIKTTDSVVQSILHELEASNAVAHKATPLEDVSSHQQPSPEDANLWHLRNAVNSQLADREVFANEVTRLFKPNQPQSRVLNDEDQSYVAVRKIQGMTPVDAITHTAFNQRMMDVQDRDPAYKDDASYTGLGRLMVMMLLTNSVNLKLSELNVNDNNEIIRTGGESAFSTFNDNPEKNYKITSELLALLPYKGAYDAYNWLDQVVDGKYNPNAEIFIGGHRQDFKREVQESILQIALMPGNVFEKIANHYLGVEAAEKCVDCLVERKAQLIAAACQNKDFLEYCTNPANIEKSANRLGDSLKSFKMTKNTFLVKNADELEEKLAAEKGKLLKTIASHTMAENAAESKVKVNR